MAKRTLRLNGPRLRLAALFASAASSCALSVTVSQMLLTHWLRAKLELDLLLYPETG